jgi:hypothetical protein
MNMKRGRLFRASTLAGVAALLGGVLPAGCANRGDQGRVVGAAEMNQRSRAEAQRIQNDPHLPPVARAMIQQSAQQAQEGEKMAQRLRATPKAPR